MSEPRARCEGCGRPPVVCLCGSLVALRPRTRVVVLQHPKERRNAIGTGWLVERCLGATRLVGVELEGESGYVTALSDPSAPAILLSPGPGARDLRDEPPEGPVTLVVVDGTWAHARKILRVNPTLRRLPRYGLLPARPSNYRIRREPAPHCVSTIEATVAALTLIEGEAQGFARVLGAFDAMVDHQLRLARERAENRQLRAALERKAKGG